jgi:hypothetical protein
MVIHPVVVRAIEWKYGAKLSKEEEHALAHDYYTYVTGQSVADIPARIVEALVATDRPTKKRAKAAPSRSAKKAPEILDNILKVLGKSSMNSSSVYQRFQQLHLGGAQTSIRKCMNRAAKNGGVLKKLGKGVYAIR